MTIKRIRYNRLMSWRSFPNRTVCDVLEEMRKCNETKDYSNLANLCDETINMFLSMVYSLDGKINRPNRT